MSADFSNVRVVSGENNFQEVSVRKSSVNTSAVLLEDVSDILFKNDELVFSEEINDLVNSQRVGGKTGESLEGSVRFKSGSLSKDLSRDFDILFSVGDGLEKASELIFGGKADH